MSAGHRLERHSVAYDPNGHGGQSFIEAHERVSVARPKSSSLKLSAFLLPLAIHVLQHKFERFAVGIT
jgi:hypothetical protein